MSLSSSCCQAGSEMRSENGGRQSEEYSARRDSVCMKEEPLMPLPWVRFCKTISVEKKEKGLRPYSFVSQQAARDLSLIYPGEVVCHRKNDRGPSSLESSCCRKHIF